MINLIKKKEVNEWSQYKQWEFVVLIMQQNSLIDTRSLSSLITFLKLIINN